MKKLILVVCWGNIYRSAVAEVLINRKLKEEGLDNAYECLSRGIQGSAGVPPTMFSNLLFYEKEYAAAKPSLDRFEIDLSTHKATPIDAEIVQRASIVLAMDQKVMQYSTSGLLVQFPDCEDKIYLLSDLVSERFEVEDLSGISDVEKYNQSIIFIDQTVHLGFFRILELADSTYERHEEINKNLKRSRGSYSSEKE